MSESPAKRQEYEADERPEATEASHTDNERPPLGEKSPGDTMAIQNLNDIPSNLRVWNLLAALFQFGQCAALFYLSSQANTNWYLYTNFPYALDERDAVDENITVSVGHPADGGPPEEFGRPDPTEVAGYSVTWYSAVFLALSGIDHFAVILPGLNKLYNFCIARNQNPFRWIEYSLSASLMRVMIAQLSGITDIHLLFTIFMCTATTMILGACHESVNAKALADGDRKQNWFPFLSAWIPHLASWAVILCYFFRNVSQADPPNFVWSIIFILFILDGSFALLFFLQWAKIGKFSNYVTGEKGFIVLSFTSKALLAWLNYVSASMRLLVDARLSSCARGGHTRSNPNFRRNIIREAVHVR